MKMIAIPVAAAAIAGAALAAGGMNDLGNQGAAAPEHVAPGSDVVMAQMGPLATPFGATVGEGDVTSIPDGFREWVFLGAPLTPNGLNGGAAGFPEFHHVYIHPDALAEFRRTGVFPEGTTIVKELVLLQEGHHDDGSRDEASGRGFFADRFAGIDMMVKDSVRFAETNGWGFFNFGHHEPPYAETAVAAPNEECAFCHTAGATTEMVFSTFYPILGVP